MRSLIEKIFKNEPQFNYIIAEYRPMKIDAEITRASAAEYDIDEPAMNDEMEIDRLYQRA